MEYGWDHRNRLISVTDRASLGGAITQHVEYTYDVNNRRIAKDIDADGDLVFDSGERFIYDGEHILVVFDESGSLTIRYLYGPGIDQVLAEESTASAPAPGIPWTINGQTASVVLNGGSSTWIYLNEAYLVVNGQLGIPLQYTGLEAVFDGEVGVFEVSEEYLTGLTGAVLSEADFGFAISVSGQGGNSRLLVITDMQFTEVSPTDTINEIRFNISANNTAGHTFVFSNATASVVLAGDHATGSGGTYTNYTINTQQTLWTLTDHQGTIRDVVEYDTATDATVVRNHITYDAFGQITSESDSDDAVGFGYTGRDRDLETDLGYHRRRYLDHRLAQFISEDPIGFEAGDVNYRRYVGNDPLNWVDPMGLAAKEKRQADASDKAKEFEAILPFIIDKLKQIAKDTEKLERFGFILKAKDAKAKPQYKFHECISKEAKEREAPLTWWGSEKAYGAFAVKPGKDGTINLDKENATADDLDLDYPIEFIWHTHPPVGDPWPSTQDGKVCNENNIVGLMIIYIKLQRAGKTVDDWKIWIVDTDGAAYEYKTRDGK